MQRVLLCSGKMYYTLADQREELKRNDVALVRIEELAPFPADQVLAELKKYPNASQVVWTQEEPANAGAWTWADAHLRHATEKAGMDLRIDLVARPALAASAVGLAKHNARQEAWLLKQAFE